MDSDGLKALSGDRHSGLARMRRNYRAPRGSVFCVASCIGSQASRDGCFTSQGQVTWILFTTLSSKNSKSLLAFPFGTFRNRTMKLSIEVIIARYSSG